MLADMGILLLQAHHKTLFDPPLPKQKVQAIQGIGMGVVDKIFIDCTPDSDGQQQRATGCQDPGQLIKSFQLLWPAPAEPPDGILEHATSQSEDPAATTKASQQSGSGRKGQSWMAVPNEHPRAVAHRSGLSDEQGKHSGEPVPGWVEGVYSLRFGGSEFVSSAQRHYRQHRTSSNGTAGNAPDWKQQQPAAIPNAAPGIPSLSADPHPTPEPQEDSGNRDDLDDDEWDEGSSESDDDDVEDVSSDPSVAPGHAQLGCAAAWIAGDAARQMELASDDELHRGISALLDSFPAIKLPRSFKVHRTNWGSDPLALGSYTFPSAATQVKHFGALAQPLVSRDGSPDGSPDCRPVVFFAGEATDIKHLGTTHGACFSGERAAKELLKGLQPGSV